ncbi:MAG TPA: dihydroorotate dehydrogenase electron transfer subunit [Lachnospiraceae bacterium]|jgi:dihydroorotate dehydrogenase electron transfer subunit|nr:dihydroorotate dehydrogenase electron transfer subunit [Lachnospiraceae bacterium]HBE07728.1 dihydroorotate dehydrogenase electron transfer subunit [Lachnospiraceae bacterium]
MGTSEKAMEVARVMRQDPLVLEDGIYSLWIRTDLALYAKPGQFISIYLNDASRILPRPISICEVNRDAGTIRTVYRVAGKGTEELTHLMRDDKIRIMAPLGNGYPLQGGRTLLIGGGIGIPPMLELAKELSGVGRLDGVSHPALSVTSVLGYRNDRMFLKDEFENYGKVYIATDDGSYGTHGTVIDAIHEHMLTADVIYACGPKPMLRGVKEFAMKNQIRCYLSLEERMACGVGACLGCVCKSTKVDDHSKVKNKRVCTDGPVFEAQEVDL